ncbi:MAG TPA: S41 family peptidase [Actinobacteria bacterium]|nr:S41 family peptidase [Actinomycetota bacterium]
MHKRLIIFVSTLFIVLLLAASFVSGMVIGGIVAEKPSPKTYTQPTQPNQPTQPKKLTDPADISLIQEVLAEIAHGYVEKVSTEKLINGAVDGMIKTLKDPYTRRLKKKDYGHFQEQTTGHFGGVGMELGLRKKQLTVVTPIKNTPADRAGIQAGDKIAKIDGESTKDMGIEKAVKLIRGPKGSKITLEFTRGKDKTFSKELTREEIKIPNVSGKLLNGNIAYIKAHGFNTDSSQDILDELNDLKAKGATSLILDLRNNPGGLLDEAVKVSSLFIKSGPIVKVKSRTGETDTFSASNGADDTIPLVILVNKGSASASEIVGGAIQDVGRGVLVGETTFGKGSVQTVIPLADDSALVMTTAKYLTPKNRSLNKRGIKPDVVVKLKKKDWHKMGTAKDVQLKKAKAIIRDLRAGKKIKEIKSESVKTKDSSSKKSKSKTKN